MVTTGSADTKPLTGIIDQKFIDQQVAATQGNNKTGQDGFDRDMFLKILMANLSNQSPLDTMDTQQILETQTALTQVEQVSKQTTTLKDTHDAVNAGFSQLNTTLANMNLTLSAIAKNQGITIPATNTPGN